ncbi:T9SS type A sorting domain-containing protein [soil metagenome]
MGLADSSATILWAKANTSSPASDLINSISIDQNGDAYFTGYCGNYFELDTIISNLVSTVDLLLTKFNAAGDIQWLTRLPANVYAHQGNIIETDLTGNSYVGAWYQRSNGFYDFYIGKFDNAGQLLWADTTTGANEDILQSLKVMPNGNVLVGGYVSSNPAVFDNDSIYCNSVTEQGIFALHTNPRVQLQGYVYNDLNGNGIRDGNEPGMANQLMTLFPDLHYAYTDNTGFYRFVVDTGVYSINNQLPNYHIDTSPLAPDYYIDTVSIISGVMTGNDFGVQGIPGIYDLSVDLSATPTPHPGYSQIFYLSCANIGTEQITNAILNFTFADSLVYQFSQPIFSQSNLNTLTWLVDTIRPGEHRLFIVGLNVPPNPALVGNNFISNLTFLPIVGDTIPANNSDTLIQMVTTSFDPNYKEVYPPGIGTEGYIPASVNQLTYTIHFQNTGTDTARTVVLIDSINPNLDLTTLQILAASSQNISQVINPRIISWTFPNIMLPDSGTNFSGSCGFIKYQIKLNTGLPSYTVINNSAAIFFDFNTSVNTNRTTNTIDLTLPTPEWAFSDSPEFKIFPNPFNETITIIYEGKESVTDFVLYDISGKVVKHESITGNVLEINAAGLGSGLFFYSIYDTNGSNLGNGKLVHL